jgi:hypothetical protein
MKQKKVKTFHGKMRLKHQNFETKKKVKKIVKMPHESSQKS